MKMLRVVLVGGELRGSAERRQSRQKSAAGGAGSVYANGATVGATTLAPPQRICAPWHCGHADRSQNQFYQAQTQRWSASGASRITQGIASCNQRVRTGPIGYCGHHGVAVRPSRLVGIRKRGPAICGG